MEPALPLKEPRSASLLEVDVPFTRLPCRKPDWRPGRLQGDADSLCASFIVTARDNAFIPFHPESQWRDLSFGKRMFPLRKIVQPPPLKLEGELAMHSMPRHIAPTSDLTSFQLCCTFSLDTSCEQCARDPLFVLLDAGRNFVAHAFLASWLHVPRTTKQGTCLVVIAYSSTSYRVLVLLVVRTDFVSALCKMVKNYSGSPSRLYNCER